MRYTIKGKNMEIGERTKEKVTDKLNRIKNLFPEDSEAKVLISSEKLNFIVEITVPLRKRLIRAEVMADDMMAAIDKAVDILENQVVRYKKRIRSQYRRNDSYKEEYEAISAEDSDDADLNDADVPAYRLERCKRFEVRPMAAEEAVLQMELLGHSFFVFRDGETDEINVVYKRKDGSFGIIEPR